MSFLMIDECVSDLVKLEASIMQSMDKTTTFVSDLTLVVAPDKMDQIKEQTNAVQEIVKDYIKLNDEMELYREAVKEMKKEIIKSHQDERDDADTIFQQKLHQIKGNRQNQNPENHEKYKVLMRQIESLETINSVTGMTEFLTPVGDGDLLMTQQNINTIDPITRKQMKDPVRCKLCNHVYEKSAILNLLRKNPGLYRCPIGGCRTNLKESDLESDLRLKRYIEMNCEKS